VTQLLRRFLEGSRRAIGLPGLVLAGVSLALFVLGLVLLSREYHRLGSTRTEILQGILARWVREASSNDLRTRGLLDTAAAWRSAVGPERERTRAELERSLRLLGDRIDFQNERTPLIVVLDLILRSGDDTITWQSRLAARESADTLPAFLLLPSEGGTEPPVYLEARYRTTPEISGALSRLETSYRSLLVAPLVVSGLSLLTLLLIGVNARALRERERRMSAQQATIDLADRMCHELGNAVFVLANQDRNLVDHLDRVERLVAEHEDALRLSARKAGLDAEAVRRLETHLRRELVNRGIGLRDHLEPSTRATRGVCVQIDTTTRYLESTIHDLDTHLRAGDRPPVIEPVDLDLVIDQVLAVLSPKLASRGIEIGRCAPADPLPKALADRRLLTHALINLVKNAIEASSRGEPRLEIETSLVGESPMVAVRDQGEGIPSGVLERIFEPGFSTKGPGRGQGLTIVRDCVKLQRGRLEVESERGRGTTFRIILPAAMTAAPEEVPLVRSAVESA
jgi:signal transduction histidine kinase